MNRYIDKETMRGIIREQEKSHGIRGLAWIEMAMDKQEDADVQEVRHGRWKSIYEDAFRRDGKYEHWVTEKVVTGYRCSICDCYSKTTSSYCPECGAKMDEEEQK